MKNNLKTSFFLLIFAILASVTLTAYRQPQPILFQEEQPETSPYRLFLPSLMKSAPPTPTPTLTATRTPTAVVSRTPTRTPTRTGVTPIPGNNLVIDHNSVALFSQIPDSALPAAVNTRFMFRHASIGENISRGLSCLAGDYVPHPASCTSLYDQKYDRDNWVYTYRGNNGWIDKVNDFVSQTNLQSNNFDVFSFKFGNVDGADTNTYPMISNPTNFQTLYIDKIEALEAAHPGKVFVWWTMPLDRLGSRNSHDFNNMVRAYAREHNKILFDVAAIGNYGPDGMKSTNDQGYDNLHDAYTDETRGGHLNTIGRERVAKAFWVLMARMNGWSGN